MQHQSAQKFQRLERSAPELASALIVLVTKRHPAVFQSHETVIGNGHAMGITSPIRQDVLRIGEGLFGIDHPVLAAQRRQSVIPGRGLGELSTAPHQPKLVLVIGLNQSLEVEPAEAPREHPDG